MRFVNSYQSPAERKEKYNLLIFIGASTVQARRWRDFTEGHIESIVLPYLLKNAT